MLQTTQKERYEALNVGISSGILSLNEARIKENLPPIDDNFHRLSLGSVMYDPKDRIYFIPNMSTVIDAETKHIISSPNLPVGGTVENAQNEQQKETDAKEKVDDKDE